MMRDSGRNEGIGVPLRTPVSRLRRPDGLSCDKLIARTPSPLQAFLVRAHVREPENPEHMRGLYAL
jgi:hypothetical protein